jgi:hypothetical protein
MCFRLFLSARKNVWIEIHGTHEFLQNSANSLLATFEKCKFLDEERKPPRFLVSITTCVFRTSGRVRLPVCDCRTALSAEPRHPCTPRCRPCVVFPAFSAKIWLLLCHQQKFSSGTTMTRLLPYIIYYPSQNKSRYFPNCAHRRHFDVSPAGQSADSDVYGKLAVYQDDYQTIAFSLLRHSSSLRLADIELSRCPPRHPAIPAALSSIPGVRGALRNRTPSRPHAPSPRCRATRRRATLDRRSSCSRTG